ncbi:proteasome subunit beta type-3 [Drosophila grimshawi]|uniref:GH19348 n=1 Tax=Drosophila grimshawi TaxID=7222 RepID=B4JFM6_DROGR|nr:proteasome subunit beta type-3 [Drosophila grimshawi]EDV93507.1 GH19348 [Drosophila grimshawi]
MANNIDYCNGSIIAMHGKDCVAIAVKGGNINDSNKNLYKLGARLYLGLTGRLADILMAYKHLILRKNIFELEKNRELLPKELTLILSQLLYAHRLVPFQIEAVIVGMDPDTLEPHICSLGMIGYPNVTKDFVVAGHRHGPLLGLCKSLWRPSLNPSQLYDTIGQTMIQFCTSYISVGCGVDICLIEKYKITERSLSIKPH